MIEKRLVFFSTFAGWYQQAAGIIGSLISIPYVIKYLGNETAGVWFTILSILVILQLFDFGFSAAISRQVAHTFNAKKNAHHMESTLIKINPGWEGVRDIYEFSQSISNKISISLILFLLIFYAIFCHVLNFSLIANFKNLPEIILLVFASVIYTIKSRLIQAFMDGLGRMYYSRVINGTQQLLTGLLSIAVVHSGFGVIGLMVLTSLLSFSTFMVSRYLLLKFSRNNLINTNKNQKLKLIGLYASSIPFGVMNAGSVLVGAAQIPLIAIVVGSESVATIYVALKIILVFNTTVLQYTTVQLPIFTKRCAHGDWQGSRDLMYSTVGIGAGLFILLGLLFPILTPYVLSLWVGPDARVDKLTLWLMAINFSITGTLALLAQFVLASGRNAFATSTLMHGVISISALYLMGERFGIVSIPVSAIIGLIFTNLWVNPIYAKNLDKELKLKIKN